MTRPVRIALFLVAAVGVAVCYLGAVLGLPELGTPVHPYRDQAVAAAVARSTANVVSAINYDQRALDTLGEETIVLGSVVGAAALLRPTGKERKGTVRDADETLPSVALLGYLLLPVTLLVGANLVLHGQLTPGGGFQGGVVLGTAIHLIYLTGRYQALDRVRPLAVFTAGEALGTTLFAALGLVGVATGAGFLANVLPTGVWGSLLSAGTVPLLNIAVGVEVASGVVVLLTKFLDQALRIVGAE
jgi:multicomponent Na+:H+ antiporter subunit B